MQQSDTQKTIVHVFSDGFLGTAEQLITLQSEQHKVVVVDLSDEDINYGEIIDTIFSCNEVISW